MKNLIKLAAALTILAPGAVVAKTLLSEADQELYATQYALACPDARDLKVDQNFRISFHAPLQKHASIWQCIEKVELKSYEEIFSVRSATHIFVRPDGTIVLE